MKKLLTALITLLFTLSAFAQTEKAEPIDYKVACIKFNAFYNEILKGNVKDIEARQQFKHLAVQFGSWLILRAELITDKPQWQFPLQGYNYRAAGGINGNGYSDKGYHFLDGNRHGAHPAHDIFVNDKNQDCIDDRTNQPVNVLVVDDGFVIACTNDWDATSNLRGGKFIWVFHPKRRAVDSYFSYYAHNRAIFVKPGDDVRQGQKIAEVGRTGLNAYKKRSPTHLHFSTFKLVDNIPVPFNSFSQLKAATVK